MIISASCRTDLPAFYGQWFRNRLDAGYCRVRNPFYPEQTYRVSLERPDVDAFVFWTKNLGPFLPHLEEVHRRGYPFLVLYSINGYPRELEQSVVHTDRSIDHLNWMADTFGPGAGVWRYDPVLFTSLTPPEFHLENFQRISSALKGSVDEVIISFAQLYKKTLKNLDAGAFKAGFAWHDPPVEEKRTFISQLVEVAKGHGIKVSICCQPELVVPGSQEASCIDAERIARKWNVLFKTRKKGTRPTCGCNESRDIGDYDTCPHGCLYCYAVQRRELAKERYQQHDPKSDFLFPGKEEEVKDESGQLDLFE